MTTALTYAATSRTHGAAADAHRSALAGIRLGVAEPSTTLLRAALESNDANVRAVATEPAGYVVAATGWRGAPPAAVDDLLADLGELDGRPVGLIVHANDIVDAVASVAALRSRIAAAGGLPLDGGLCVETADAVCDPSGDLADVTLHSRLVLLGCRVQRLAASRLTLRATD